MIEDELHEVADSGDFPWYVQVEDMGFPKIAKDIADVIHWARKVSVAGDQSRAGRWVGGEGTRSYLSDALDRLDKRYNVTKHASTVPSK